MVFAATEPKWFARDISREGSVQFKVIPLYVLTFIEKDDSHIVFSIVRSVSRS